MTKFKYAKIDGYLPVIQQEGAANVPDVDWYVRINTVGYGHDGLGRDKEGNTIRTGVVEANDIVEAGTLIKAQARHVGEFKVQLNLGVRGWINVNNDLKSKIPDDVDALAWLRHQHPALKFRVVFARKEN